MEEIPNISKNYIPKLTKKIKIFIYREEIYNAF